MGKVYRKTASVLQCRHMFGRKDPHSAIEFILLGIFGAVVLIGIMYGVVIVLKNGGVPAPSSSDVVPVAEEPLVAPTQEEYDLAANDVMSPFLAQATLVTEASFEGDVSALGDLVTKTEERMIRLRVPAERQEAHLAAVLLLGSWKRAVAGSATDRAEVSASTAAFIAAMPWATR